MSIKTILGMNNTIVEVVDRARDSFSLRGALGFEDAPSHDIWNPDQHDGRISSTTVVLDMNLTAVDRPVD